MFIYQKKCGDIVDFAHGKVENIQFFFEGKIEVCFKMMLKDIVKLFLYAQFHFEHFVLIKLFLINTVSIDIHFYVF